MRCTTAEAFTNEFIGALHGGRIDAFKARYRDIDVLLVDDVQFLRRKAKTEEEFFHTFNALHDAGAPDRARPPTVRRATSRQLEDRLRERFEAGLVADISAPDLPTRLDGPAQARGRRRRSRSTTTAALAAIAERVDDATCARSRAR